MDEKITSILPPSIGGGAPELKIKPFPKFPKLSPAIWLHPRENERPTTILPPPLLVGETGLTIESLRESI